MNNILPTQIMCLSVPLMKDFLNHLVQLDAWDRRKLSEMLVRCITSFMVHDQIADYKTRYTSMKTRFKHIFIHV